MSVKNYIKNKKQTPLYFVNSYGVIKEIEGGKEISLEKLIYVILDFSSTCYSRDKDVVETGPSRRRSVLDIWRHVKYYLPETTIYQVMNSLYKIKDELFSEVCLYIQRRVFKLGKFILFKVCDNRVDEFGFSYFNEWENISEETDNNDRNYYSNVE
jgi:hypothetical protein